MKEYKFRIQAQQFLPTTKLADTYVDLKMPYVSYSGLNKIVPQGGYAYVLIDDFFVPIYESDWLVVYPSGKKEILKNKDFKRCVGTIRNPSQKKAKSKTKSKRNSNLKGGMSK